MSFLLTPSLHARAAQLDISAELLDAPFLEGWARACLGKMELFNGRELANMVWALAKLRLGSNAVLNGSNFYQRWAKTVCDKCARRALDPHALSSIMHSLARLELDPSMLGKLDFLGE